MDGVGGGSPVFVVIDTSGGHSRFGEVLIHEPLHHIDPVREQVGNLTPTEIQVSPPIPVLLNIPIPPGTGAKKLLPVESDRLLREWSAAQMITVPVPPGSSDGDFA